MIQGENPFAVGAADRIEHYMELMDIEEEDLGLIVAPWYNTHEDIHSGERLSEEDYYWEMHVHARDVSALRDPGTDLVDGFDEVFPFDYDEMGDKEFLEIEYTTWINVFEDEFPEAEIYSPDLPSEL